MCLYQQPEKSVFTFKDLKRRYIRDSSHSINTEKSREKPKLSELYRAFEFRTRVILAAFLTSESYPIPPNVLEESEMAPVQFDFV